MLVETEWVAEHLNDSGLRFVEADEDILLYEQGHIPGAVKLDWLVDVQNPVQRDFVDKAGFEALMSRWGISNDVWEGTLLGVSSMYLGFFAWYRGLALAGIARGSQVQQVQPLLTLVWSAWLLDEHVTAATVVAAMVVIVCVVWAQRARVPAEAAPQE